MKKGAVGAKRTPNGFRLPSCTPHVYAPTVKRADRTWARRFFKDSRAVGSWDFERWLAYVTQIDVDLRPNGRAILTHPDLELPVEIRWDAAGVRSFHVYARPEDSFPRVEVLASPFLAALELRRREAALDPAAVSGSVTSTAPSFAQAMKVDVVSPPAAGKPPSLAFYRKILAEYDALIADHEKAPVAELARRYGRPPDTVKSWRFRGLKLKREGRL